MNALRLRALLRSELAFHATRPLTWILVVVLLLTSYGLSSGNVSISSGDATVGAQSKVWQTSEFSVAMVFPLVAFLLYVFFIAVAAGMTVPRDDELQVQPLLHSTPLTPAEYITGKFVAVLGTFLGVLTLHLLFQILFNHFWPHANAELIRGPFALSNYLRPALFLALPCLVFFCGASLTVGERTRSPILVFAAPTIAFLVSAFFLFNWSPSWLDPRINRLLMWIEPSGFRWVNETWLKVDRGVDFYNTQRVVYDGPFLLSRLAYLLAGLGCVFWSSRHLASATRDERVRVKAAPAAELVVAVSIAQTLEALGMRRSVPSFLRTAFVVARFEARNLASQPGLYLFVPVILVQTIFGESIGVGRFGTSLLMTSGTAAVTSMNTLTLLLSFLLLFYSVESVLRESNTGLRPILHATPTRTTALLLGKALANSIVAALILLASMLGSFAVILYQGQLTPDVRPFLLVWGFLLLPTLLLWSSYVMALLALTANRYTTYALGLATLAFTGWKQQRGEMNWVGNWNLWSATTWSDFGTLQPNIQALLWNRLFYLAVMGFLVALTVKLFPRREADSGATLDRLRPRRLLRTSFGLLLVALPAIVAGASLYLALQQGFQGNVTRKREEDYRARNLASWAYAETPQVAAVDLEVELEPARSSFSVRGSYVLVNKSPEAMRSFPMSIGDHFEDVKWTLQGEEFTPEHRSRLEVFTPAQPLAVGDSVRVGFSHHGRLPRGFTKNGGGMGQFVLPAGVVLTSFESDFVPVPYYEAERGVDDDNRIEPRDYASDFFEGPTRPALGSGVSFDVATRITGPADYDYHAPGVRLSDETVEGRRTVQWQTDHPVNFFNIVAGKWAVWEGDGATIYYHPEHSYNVQEMGETLLAARRWFSEWFYPYPWQDLRVNEFAGIASYAQGFPTNITFSEGIGFLTRVTKEINAPFLVTAHETAHQWWGNLLMPGDGPGGNVLSEGMAHFSTILLFERVKGEADRIEFCKRIEESYGDSRVVDSEKPLVQTQEGKPSDRTVFYDKGGWVFFMLHRLMGESASFAGLHDFIATYTGGGHFPEGPDFPVLQDFVRVLRTHAPDPVAFDEFVAQWFFDVVVPEYRLSDLQREEVGGGKWLVRGTLVNAGTGRMRVDVAASEGEQEARTAVVVGAGDSVAFEIPCDFEASQVVVDPDVLVLMLEREKAMGGISWGRRAPSTR